MNSKIKENEKEDIIEKKKKKLGIIIISIIVFCMFAVIIFIGIATYNEAKKAAKPIIYLYPEQTTELSVTLGNPKKLTCSYPDYYESDKANRQAGKQGGWNVIANPNGDIIDTNTGRKLYALYWEGKNNMSQKIKEGFVVKSEETIPFLEEKLAKLGLNEKEAEEFIVYWLPQMQENKYNLIRFATKEEIEKDMPLNFSVQPDTVIRVLMQYKGFKNTDEIKKYCNVKDIKEIQKQEINTPERKGFVAVEWGGSVIE